MAIGILSVVLLIAIGLALYLPLAPAMPVLDDAAVALENPTVRAPSPNWFRAPFYADQYRPLWRPLATLTLRWNWLASGEDVSLSQPEEARAVRHAMALTNVLLFLGAGLLVLALLRALGLGPWAALAAAVILVAHPANVESVLRLAGRSELLAQALVLAALVLYVDLSDRPRPSPTGDSVAGRWRGAWHPALWIAWGMAFFLGLLGHEAALILPLLLVGYEAARGATARTLPQGRAHAANGRRAWPPVATALLVCLGIVVLWAVLREGVLRGLPPEFKRNPASDYLRALDDAERVRLALYLPLLYSGILLFTVPILPDYSHLLARPANAPDVVLGEPRSYGVQVPDAGQTLLGLALLLAGVALFLWLRRRNPRAAFGAWVFVAGLLIALPLLGTNGQVASSRHLFFPLLGLVILLAGLADGLATRGHVTKRIVLAASAVLAVIVVFMAGANARTAGRAWSSSNTLMARLAQAAPLSPEVPLYHAGAAMSRGDLERAATYFEESLGRFPRNARVLLNLGLIRAQQEQYSIAGRILHDAAVVADRTMPGTAVAAKAHLSVGTLFARQGMEDLALEEFCKAVAADSTNVSALASAGLLEATKHETARDGVRHLSRALELDPQGRVLGATAAQVREVRDRAVFNLNRTGKGAEDYEAGMNPPDSSWEGSGRQPSGRE